MKKAPGLFYKLRLFMVIMTTSKKYLNLMDVGLNNELSSSGIYKQTEKDFLEKWKNMLKIYIELV